MKMIAQAHLPRMRVDGLVVDDLPDEVLVYDRDRHKAHCLNQTAGLVWRSCDGKSTAEQIAARLSAQHQTPFNEQLVWLALDQLQKIDLLEQPVMMPPPLAGMSRRRMVRALGLAAAVAVPLVTSIVAPTAAQAATCIQSGQNCSATIACCSVLGCSGTPPTGICN